MCGLGNHLLSLTISCSHPPRTGHIPPNTPSGFKPPKVLHMPVPLPIAASCKCTLWLPSNLLIILQDQLALLLLCKDFPDLTTEAVHTEALYTPAMPLIIDTRLPSPPAECELPEGRGWDLFISVSRAPSTVPGKEQVLRKCLLNE